MNRFAERFVNRVKNRFVNRFAERFVNRVKNRRAIRACASTIERRMDVSVYCRSVHRSRLIGEQRKQLKCSPPSLVARLDFCVYGLSRRTAVAAEIEDMPPVREESTSIASFAGLTSSVDRPAIDTFNTSMHRARVPFYYACACAYCSSILYSIHKSFCKSIHKSILYSIHKPFCKSILYSIYKSFCKSILAINKTIFGINKTIFRINKSVNFQL